MHNHVRPRLASHTPQAHARHGRVAQPVGDGHQPLHGGPGGPAQSPGTVVINELHYNPDMPTEQVEFIELYNAGSTAVDLSGWALEDAVDYFSRIKRCFSPTRTSSWPKIRPSFGASSASSLSVRTAANCPAAARR
ncbi:MAG: lamin tail domain-containing protein [Caldilineaceae bacterium]